MTHSHTHLNRYGLEGSEDDFSALVQPLSVTSDLQRRLVDTTQSHSRRMEVYSLKSKHLLFSLSRVAVVSAHQRGHGEADDLDAAVVVALRLKVPVVARVSPRHGASTVPVAHVRNTSDPLVAPQTGHAADD